MDNLVFSIIVALSRNLVIGVNDELPWEGKLRRDMMYFKKTTIGHGNNVIIVGRKTFMSIPEEYRPLNGRVNIVLSRIVPSRDDTWIPPSYDVADNCADVDKRTDEGLSCIIVAQSLEEALTIASRDTHGEDREVFIIGGGKVYKEALENDRITRMYLTRVDADIEGGDTFFPEFDSAEWELVKQLKFHEPDEQNIFGHQFEIYERVAKGVLSG